MPRSAADDVAGSILAGDASGQDIDPVECALEPEAVRVCEDMNGGIADRLVSTNVGGAAIVTGHVVASATRNAVSSALVLGVAFAIGFRPHAGAAAWLGAAGLLIAFIVAVSAVPIATMPTWIWGFARHQPATPAIGSMGRSPSTRRRPRPDQGGKLPLHQNGNSPPCHGALALGSPPGATTRRLTPAASTSR